MWLCAVCRHVVLPLTIGTGSNTGSGHSTSAADSRKWALSVGLSASKSGLLDHLHRHLDSLHDQLQSRELQSGSTSSSVDSTSSDVPFSSNDDHTAGSSQQTPQATTQHLLAQLLLVHQWTAALCRIWPSSIPDAAPLRSLLSSTISVAGQLVTQLPYMQAAMQGPSTASGVGTAATVADSSSGAGTSAKQLTQLALPVTAAVLEVAALVLEPLGLLMRQQQQATQQGSQPPSLSAPAKQLCAELQGDTLLLLQAMLTVCLHQLVLHAERKQQEVTHVPANTPVAPDSSIQQQGRSFSPTGSCASADRSSSASRSTAELAEGYLLQHADPLQAKQPAAPSRAAVAAWRAVCQRQWADMSLPLTLQEAAAVLASIQPGAAGGPSEVLDSADVTALWAMQECGTFGGQFGASGSGSLAAGVDIPAASSSNSSSHRDSRRSRGDLQGSEPILSIASCVHTATALSAVCQHLVDTKSAACSTTNSMCNLIRTLLATAAAAASLQGAAAMPMVSAAVAAATAAATVWAGNQPSDQFHGSGTDAEPHMVTAVSPAACDQDEWLLCMSLAANLTTAVLQLDGQHTEQPDQMTSVTVDSWPCLHLLLVLLDHMRGVKYSDTAVQRLQSAAYALQVIEAAIRRHAASAAASGFVALESEEEAQPGTYSHRSYNKTTSEF